MQGTGDAANELRQEFPGTPELLCPDFFATLPVVGKAYVVSFVGGQVDITHAAVRRHQLAEHAQEKRGGFGIRHARFIVAIRKGAEVGVFGVFQDKCDVGRSVEPGDKLHVIAQSEIRQFLQVRRRYGIRLHEGRRPLVYEVSLLYTKCPSNLMAMALILKKAAC